MAKRIATKIVTILMRVTLLYSIICLKKVSPVLFFLNEILIQILNVFFREIYIFVENANIPHAKVPTTITVGVLIRKFLE